LAIAEAAYVVAIGGGILPAWGQLAPVPVLLTVASASGFALAAAGVTRTGTSAAGSGVALVAVALSGLSLALSITRMLPGMHELRTVTSELTDIGQWLGARLPAGTAVSALP